MRASNGKTLGVLGGMGPYAALEFCKKILDLTHPVREGDHIHVLLDNNIRIPSRTRYLMYGEESPSPEIISAVNRLVTYGAEVIALPCNSVHYFYDEVASKIKAPWINLIATVQQKLISLNLSRPLILGGYITTELQTYSKFIKQSQYPSQADSKLIYSSIEDFKLNRFDAGEAKLSYFLSRIHQYSFDSIVLACTELTFSKNFNSLTECPVLDSTHIYAESIVSYMTSER